MYEPRYVRATVTGEVPIRDSLTRESVEPGGTVVLLVREPGTEKAPPCPRHPKKRAGFSNPAEPCYCGGIVIEFLVEQGAIGDVQPHDPAAKAAAPAPKAEKGKV
jgi:hypothetical protein